MKTTNQVNRSQRLEKKLYVGQYAVLGFEVSFKFTDIDEQTFDTFFSELMAFVDSRQLILGGAGGTEHFVVYVSHYGRYTSATEQDRNAFEQWLSERSFIIESRVDALSDAYYGV